MKFKLFSSNISLSSRKLLNNSGLYALGNFGAAIVPFLLMPILTRYLEPSEYGILSMYNIVFAVLNTFTGLSIHGAIIREYSSLSPKEFSVFVFNCLGILLVSTLCIEVIIFFSSSILSSYTYIPESYFPFIVLSSSLQFVIIIMLAVLQVRGDGFKFMITQLLSAFLHGLLTLILIVYFDFGWDAKLWAHLLVFSPITFLGYFFLKRNNLLKVEFNLDFAKKAILFGIPLIPHTLGMYAITFTDRIMVTNMLGIASNGVFAVGIQFGMVIMFIQDAFNKAWLPWFYERMESGILEVRAKIVKITYVYSFCIFAIAFLYSYIIPYFIPYLVGEDYQNISRIILWSSLGFAFNGVYKMMANYILYERKTIYLSYVTFITALINIILTFYFIKFNEEEGASQATMITFSISCILTFLVARKICPMPWWNFRIL